MASIWATPAGSFLNHLAPGSWRGSSNFYLTVRPKAPQGYLSMAAIFPVCQVQVVFNCFQDIQLSTKKTDCVRQYNTCCWCHFVCFRGPGKSGKPSSTSPPASVHSELSSSVSSPKGSFSRGPNSQPQIHPRRKSSRRTLKKSPKFDVNLSAGSLPETPYIIFTGSLDFCKSKCDKMWSKWRRDLHITSSVATT